MRFYVGQRFVGTIGGERHLFTTAEQYRGGPVEVVADTGARFPTAVMSTMVGAGVAVADHSCLTDGLEGTPAYVRAERCASCQQLGGAAAELAGLTAATCGR